MFLRPPDKIQPSWKRPVYITATIIQMMLLGVLFQIIALVVVDRDGQLQSFSPTTWWRIAILVFFGLVGFFLGRLWWRWVYTERRWWKDMPSEQTKQPPV